MSSDQRHTQGERKPEFKRGDRVRLITKTVTPFYREALGVGEVLYTTGKKVMVRWQSSYKARMYLPANLEHADD